MAAPHRLAGGEKADCRFPGRQEIDKDAFWTTPMDILIPAALEGQITRERAEKLTRNWCWKGPTAQPIRKRTTSCWPSAA